MYVGGCRCQSFLKIIIKKGRKSANGEREMKVYNEKYTIQTNGSPIKFVGKDEMVDEINQAFFFDDEESANEDIKGKTDCKVISCKITYEF